MPIATNFRRLLLPVALAFAVLAGAAWMGRMGAPAFYPVVNLAALAIGLIVAAIASRFEQARVLRVAAIASTLLVGLTFASSGLEGVHRWVAMGPLRLHAAMLVGPPLMVAAMRLREALPSLAIIGCAALFAAQPDVAASGALAAGAMVAAAQHRTRWSLGAALATLGALAFCAARPDPLDPVPFVEGVIPAMAAHGWHVAIAALAFATLAPAAMREGRAFAAWQAGLVVAALAGPYPTPLIGYGAAPIIGYAVALGLMGRTTAWRFRS